MDLRDYLFLVLKYLSVKLMEKTSEVKQRCVDDHLGITSILRKQNIYVQNEVK